jgi:hypothetical protein
MIARIDETVKEYSAQFDKLMDMLKEEVWCVDEDLLVCLVQ